MYGIRSPVQGLIPNGADAQGVALGWHESGLWPCNKCQILFDETGHAAAGEIKKPPFCGQFHRFIGEFLFDGYLMP
jgi:hypothetical protein